MPAQNQTAGGVVRAVFGTLGLSALAGLLVTVMVAPAIAVTGVTANSTIGIFDALPEYIELNQGSQQNEIVGINAAGEEVPIATIFYQNRQEIPLDQMSPHLANAAVAGEDRRFEDHGGVDLPSVIRAALGQVSGDDAGGASTLTMQLVRNIIVNEIVNNPDYDVDTQRKLVAEALAPTIERKLQEMKYAISLEKEYSKDEILQAYLNIAGFGGNTYGVQAASEQYFSKDAADLTIAEAASLIAIVQYPNSRDLRTPENYAANQDRRDVILNAMAAEGYITEAERDEAKATPVDEDFVDYAPPQNGCLAAYSEYRFPCDYAVRQVPELEALGATEAEREDNWRKGGYKLVLSIDTEIQWRSSELANQYAPKEETRFELGSAVSTVEVGTGRILTMAQNKTFDNRLEGVPAESTAVNFNVDTRDGGAAGFQPGSTYKPFVLLAFLDAGHGVNESFDAGKLEMPMSAFRDSCIEGGVWGGPPYKFKNDAGETGSYTAVRGTAGSVNSVFIQMAAEVDQCRIAEMAASIGVHRGDGAPDGSDLDTRPACSIGGCDNNIAPLTMAAAYAAISNQGVYCEPIIIDRVVRNGEDLPGQASKCGQSLVTPEVAAGAIYAMQAVMTGTARQSNPNDGTPYFGKTGTQDDSKYTWMVGSSSEAATAVWVGNIIGHQPLRQISVGGINAASLRHYIFKPIAQLLDARYPGVAWPSPPQELLTGNPVFVPDGLIGQSPEAAKAAIELAELVYEDAGPIDSDLPVGVVAQIEPGAGSSVPRGTSVKVWISNGQSSAVPDVSSDGYSYADAADELEAAGFPNTTQACVAAEAGDPPSSVGTVVAQDPAAGAVVNRNTTVTLTVRQLSCGGGPTPTPTPGP